jgi:V/A-type H+-transporting ATPase subunit A
MEEVKDAVIGEVYRIAGPVATAIGAIDVSGKGIRPRIYDLIQIGHQKLIGEVIGIKGEQLIIQVYEDTSGVKPGDPVINTGEPLTVELGPGLLTSIYDGIQRPLPVIKEKRGDFIERGVFAPALDRKKWEFKPTVKRGDKVDGGAVIGTTQEMQNVEHKIMMPPKTSGVVKEIYEGEFTIDELICILEDGAEITMMQKWPVRVPRPFKKKLMPNEPLITGQRILDTLFPVAKGGTAVIPGGFGTGKTVCQHQLSKWSDAKIIVYVGCGERGNEMCEVLTEFPKLEDPWTGRPLMERSILIANTSNMPVAAREASVYTGITIALNYRPSTKGQEE